jgi:sec-independent protein translocase protein TatA
MGFSSAWHWVLVLLVVLILFGAGKIPRVMGDVAKGIKSFKAGLKEDDTVDDATPPVTTTTVPPRETHTPV